MYHLEKKRVDKVKVKPLSHLFLLLKGCFDSCLPSFSRSQLHHESETQKYENNRLNTTVCLMKLHCSLFICSTPVMKSEKKKIVQTRQHFLLICHEPVSQHASLHCCVALQICLCIPNWGQILIVSGRNLKKKQFKEHFVFPVGRQWQWSKKVQNVSWLCANWVMMMVITRRRHKEAIIWFFAVTMKGCGCA